MSEYDKSWYEKFIGSMDLFGSDRQFDAIYSLLTSGNNTFSFNKKIMEKAIDISWVEAIEEGLPHLGNCIRNPRKTIEDVEEVVPIALSKKITVDSIKHLGQHTDLIQSVDEKTGKITPSKILNVHKEESLMTYENKFVNTLVDRLYVFISKRYEKLTQVKHDEEVFSLKYDGAADDRNGRKMNISLKIETVDSLEATNEHGLTVWDRVEKIRNALEGYKGSQLCQALGNNYIRPPVMRTNAIMKNVDLKACLILWQYIAAYDKVGYEIRISDTAQKPDKEFIDDIYKTAVVNFLLLRAFTKNDISSFADLKTQQRKAVKPKIVRNFDENINDRFDLVSDSTAPPFENPEYVQYPAHTSEINDELVRIIQIEQNYIEDEEQRRVIAEAEKAKRDEAERVRLENERIKREIKEERKRIQLAKAEEARKAREERERRRAELEAIRKAEEEEQKRLEQERLERLEEERRLSELERQRREQEDRLLEEKNEIRNSLGSAVENFQAQSEDESALSDESAVIDYESPAEVARRAKEEQQKREALRKERDRADHLKAERVRLESKSFSEIYRDYSRNPVHMVYRGIKSILANVFGIIPEDTDNPDLRKKLELRKQQEHERNEARRIEAELEILFEKYSPELKYQIKRHIKYLKFKRNKKKNDKNKPRIEYKPVVRSAEEQKQIHKNMKSLYKKYHVSVPMRIIRYVKKELEKI